MTRFEDLKLKRAGELLKAAEAAAIGDMALVNFHSNAAAGFTLKISNTSVEDLEQEV